MKKIFVSLVVLGLLAGCGNATGDDAGKVTGAIKVYTRDASSGTREAFEKGIDFEGKLTKQANEVSSNDDMAVGAIKRLHAHGIAVPQQVSVICQEQCQSFAI